MNVSSPSLQTPPGRQDPPPGRSDNTLGVALLGIATATTVAACSAFGAKAAEEPAHQVLIEDGEFQVREYDAYGVAETVVSPPLDSATRTGFGRLVRYISGSNSARQKIEMTAPVELKPRGEKIEMTAPVVLSPAEYSGGSPESMLTGEAIETWTMAFVLPEGYSTENAPIPSNPAVRVRDVVPRRVATIRFSGSMSERKAEEQRKRLEFWIQERGMEHLSDWSVAGYNPPWTIPQLRRNEVMVTLR